MLICRAFTQSLYHNTKYTLQLILLNTIKIGPQCDAMPRENDIVHVMAGWGWT